ncbi:MAG TPA: class I SAM-dependent RNA methyltransferase [Candidatus Aphodousia gallistercoris]|nr:class I SAM-dependent RNA methyltransferase [Candidatus Aphodousia gallistercoris]
MSMPNYHFFAVCPRTLEPVLADELTRLGAENTKINAGGVLFDGPLSLAMAACLHSRYASRILLKIASRQYYDSHDIYDMAHVLPWEKYFSPEAKIRVDITAQRSPLESLDFTTLRIKDGICDRFREVCNQRPSIEKNHPDVRIHAFITERYCTFYFNLSGEPLFKRGWRVEKGEAPLKENLAAGLLALSEWDPQTPLMDTFCGSGTIAIEAAQIACHMAPGLNRHFAFENLHMFDMELWQEMKEDARAEVNLSVPVKIAASDISSIVVGKAQSNAERAGLGRLIEDGRLSFTRCDAREVTPIAEHGIVVTNPPYGEQSNPKSASVASMMKNVADNFKRQFAGWTLWMLTSDRLLPRQMRLSESRKIVIFNGPLECRFFKFEMVSGSFRKKDKVES